MRNYIGIVHHDKDSAFGVYFPDVPGCFSAVDNMDNLVAAASEALTLHLEGETPPAPRDMDEISIDPDIQQELKEGAVMIIVPLIRLVGRSAKANVTMDAGLLQAIDATAKHRGLTRSSFLADLARREITGQ